MSAPMVLPGRNWLRAHGASASLVLASVVLSAALGRLVVEGAAVRIALLFVGSVVGAAVVIAAPRSSLKVLVGWLFALGLLRRMLDLGFGVTRLDPVLLVAPLTWVLLVAVAARRGAFALRTRFATTVLVFSGLVVAGGLNPLQGSAFAGVAGLLFVLVPMLAFWVGRAADGSLMRGVLKVYGICAILAALYGFLQTFSSFPSWDEQWIRASGYGSLNISGAVRPFSTLSSAGEYSFVLACGIVIWASPVSRRVPRLLRASVIALLGLALLFESSRSPVVMIAVGIGAMAACRLGRGFLMLTVAVFVGLLLVTTTASSLAHDFGGSSRRGALVQHQLSGLAQPTNPSNSTLFTHLKLVAGGLGSMLHAPAGKGLAAVTIAGSRFGGNSGSTEADPSNMSVALGIPGFLLYVALAIMALRLAVRRARESRTGVELAAVGLVFVTFLQWLNGGQYAVAFLPWLLLGYLDRAEAENGQ